MKRAGLLVAGASATVLAVALASTADHQQSITRRYMPADRERDRYVYLPFDVAEGTTELRIEYRYERAQGRNTVDLGVFEPGSLELGTRALRGYSGGSRSTVTIGQCDSSPGYRTGDLPAGRWHAMLGLYQVADSGVDVTVTIDSTSGPPCVPPGIVGSLLGYIGDAPAGPSRWWSGALHAHTLHSDGAEPPMEVLRRAGDAGLDFVSITDHNNTTHVDEVVRGRSGRDARPLWIAGEEITTPGGHANAWGLPPGWWIDFRARPGDGRIAELVEATRRHGALFSLNHPAGECSGCSWEHDVPTGVAAIEVWNGRHGAQDRAVALWERLLGEGRRITAVGASDWHRDPDPIDQPHVRVLAPALTQAAILDGIRAGRVIVMRSAADSTPAFVVRIGEQSGTVGESVASSAPGASIEIDAAGMGGGQAILVANGRRLPALSLDRNGRARQELPLGPGHVRLELYSREGALVALTNPVFIVP